tara:strand:+ start:346 stop:585 length:240 start_codon:yes stop_codon:yes gene_type:complete
MEYNKYQVVLNNDLDVLVSEVNTLISKGCSPLGGLIVSNPKNQYLSIYMQTMIAPEKYNFFYDDENKLLLVEDEKNLKK